MARRSGVAARQVAIDELEREPVRGAPDVISSSSQFVTVEIVSQPPSLRPTLEPSTMRSSRTLLAAPMIAFLTAVSPPTAGAAEDAGTGVAVEVEVEVGYDAGFDFEALGVMAAAWRLGRGYFEDALLAARHLDAAIDAFLGAPGPATLAEARRAWTVARTPYLRTEVFRYISPEVARWARQVSGWPLSDDRIDYGADLADDQGSSRAAATLIATTDLAIDGAVADSRGLPAALGDADRGSASDRTVITGYHAIEFMLWGPDRRTTAPGAGDRPWTDFTLDPETCTHGHCDRRRAFLELVSERLVADLEDMVARWQPAADITTTSLGGDAHAFIERLLTGTAAFLEDDLAGARIGAALSRNDPDRESDRYSDQTHRSLYYGFDGVRSLFLGAYHISEGLLPEALAERRRRHVLKGGTRVLDLYTDASAAKHALAAAYESLIAITECAETGAPFDTLIAADNPAGNRLVQSAMNRLLDLSTALRGLVM